MSTAKKQMPSRDPLPVVRWLQAGVVAAGVGVALMAAPGTAAADADGGVRTGPGAGGNSARSSDGVGSSAVSRGRAARPVADRSRSSAAAVKPAAAARSGPKNRSVRSEARGAAVRPADVVAASVPVAAALNPVQEVPAPQPQSVAGVTSPVGQAKAIGRQANRQGPVNALITGLLDGVRRFNYTFFNTAPTLNPTPYIEDPATGVLSGNLGATDRNGDIITFAVDVSPLHGILDINEDGSYTYTPDITTAQNGGIDEFTVRALDDTLDNPWHIHLVNDVFNGLNRVAYGLFGIQPFPDRSVAKITTEVAPAVTGSKPGLIASDSLKVVKTTGEWPFTDDEPVMLSLVLQVVAGGKDTTNTSLVNYGPGEIGGAGKGETIPIPDSDGDTWVKTLTPLTAADIEKATDAGVGIPIPVVSVVTLMLEGDKSTAEAIGDMGKTLLPTYNKVGKVVEATEFKSLDVTEDVKKMLATIAAEVTPSTAQIIDIVVLRIRQWISAGLDPDDPVSLGVTVLIPVDATVIELFDNLGGPSALGLDNQWMYTTTFEMRNSIWSANIPTRVGFLAPPETLPGGKPANWETTYAGDYLDNDWAEWVVKTEAWPTITWSGPKPETEVV